MGGQGPGDQTEDTRDGCEVVEAVPARAVHAIGLVEVGGQTGEGVRVVVLPGDVSEPFAERFPFGATVRGRVGDVRTELVVGPLCAGDADDREPVVEDPAVGEPGEGGKDLARGEVAGRPEDDHGHRGDP